MNSEAEETQQEAAKTPDGKTPGTATPPKTYSQDEVDKLIGKSNATLNREIASLKSNLATNKKTAETLQTQLNSTANMARELQKAKDEAEFNAIPRDNPDALSLFTARQAHRDSVREHEATVAQFNEREAQFQADIADLKEYNKLKAASEIVSRDEFKGVKANDLVMLTDGSPEKMEALAKILALTATSPVRPAGSEIPPDPGSNLGGVSQLTTEQADMMSMEQYANHPDNVARMKSS